MRLLIAVLFLILTGPLAAQETFLFKGIVTDSLDGEPLVGATVTIDFGDQTDFVNEKGEFTFVLPRKKVVAVVRYVGYLPYRQTINLPEENLKVKMRRVENQLQEVIVSGLGSETVKRPVLGVSTLSVKAIEKLPTALGEVDILKGLQMLPGISSVGEASNGVNVRGGTTDQNLFLLDDGPIFNPTHMFGLFSAFPSEAVTSFDLYKGNVPARFGGRAAAVLDVKLANPDLSKFKMQGGISLVSNKLKMDIPIIKNKMGLMVAGRGSFNDFLFPIISDQLRDLKAKFGDGAAKLFYQINDKQTLTLSSYYSYDFFQTEMLGTIGNINASASQFEYSTRNFSGKWFWALSDKANIQTTLVSSYYQPSTLLPENNSDNTVEIKQSIDYQQAKTNLNLYQGKNNIEMGLDVVKYSINPGQILPGMSESVLPLSTPVEQGVEMGFSLEDVIDLNDRTSFSLGLRYSHFLSLGPSDVRVYTENEPRDTRSLSETITYAKGEVAQSYGGFEPRAGLRFSLSDRSSIKLGYNMARQYLQIVSNTTTPIPTSRWKLSDLNIKPQVSQLYSVGYFQDSPGSVFEFSTELYYRNTDNIIDYKPGADFLLNSTPETEILQGINRSYGAEFMFSKKKGEVTGWVNYTYARSLNQVNEGPKQDQQVNFGQWYAANYDRPHTLNASMVINQGEHHDFSFIFTYSTGRPFTSPQGYISYNNQILPFYFNRNDIRLPDYHRLDFAWNIYNPKLRNKKFKGNFAFSIYNLYGRKNAYSVFFRSENNKLNPYKLTIFGAPILSLAYKFTFNH
ncbi:TonB-dependent receptor [Jiulongibacter sediminis]|uniref:TonB-dependent receptor n=1 Tax=Jiulongibacter sediminis TaxID=1605367 RepID=A0A0P7C0E8_9BACT|nr:carboxypeptidase-like regulatory domain-containing protein [Jiulongibacter sediminis]KPM48040.1 TonB-dependent receptor [Jiulongibacter sediminis]TBX24221.1 TonB-dependent receptor [Jiulongibacter sediminis]